MPSTEIINEALDLLEEEPILSLGDNRSAVRWMNRNHDPVRDGLLRLHPWNFAKRRASLPARAETPKFGWRYAYPKPSDCLRVLPLADLGARNGLPTDFSVEGPDILCNAGSPLNVQYIARVEDAGAFDALFRQCFVTSLAARAANYITGKQSYAERLGKASADALIQAQMVNGLEGFPEETYDDDWVRGRQTGPVDGRPWSSGDWR